MDVVDELIGRSPAMVALREQIRALLAREGSLRKLPPILLTGETGTGKSLIARVIHRGGSRSKAELVEVSAVAIPENLIESELFGFERGAFTDARQPKPGLLQVAHRGTLFLDEVGEIPFSVQAKLLKVLEDGTVRRLGSTRSEPADMAIISATNADLPALIRGRRFREDLFQRLAVIRLTLPALRERGDDIVLLAEEAMARTCEKYSGPAKKLGDDAMAAMLAYRWPGNVRELNSKIEKAVLLCPTPVIPAAALGIGTPPEVITEAPYGTGDMDLDEFQRRRLSDALSRTGWNISRTAALLGVTRNTVRARIARYGLRGVPEGEGAAPETDAPRAETAQPAVESPERVALTAGAGGSKGRPSIAVLPFRIEGDDASKAYIGEGIVEDIVSALAALRELMVISRSSTLRYRGAVDVRAVGGDLGVSYALSGSVRHAGARMRVSVELAETTGGAVVWASHFDGTTEDLFALHPVTLASESSSE